MLIAQSIGYLSEWLRSRTRNAVGNSRVGSNPAVVEHSFFFLSLMPPKSHESKSTEFDHLFIPCKFETTRGFLCLPTVSELSQYSAEWEEEINP